MYPCYQMEREKDGCLVDQQWSMMGQKKKKMDELVKLGPTNFPLGSQVEASTTVYSH